MAEPDQAGVVIHGLRNEFTVDVSVNGLRRLSGSFAIDLARVSRAAGQSGGCGGGYGNVVVSSTTRASRADLRAASMTSRTCRARSPLVTGTVPDSRQSRRCSTREARPMSTVRSHGAANDVPWGVEPDA